MKSKITDLLSNYEWRKRKPATDHDIQSLEKVFGIKLPADYEEVLRFSNGCSLYGFSTPLIIYSIIEVIALYSEHDLYRDIPSSLIFGGDGGGTIYCFDLRDDQRQVLFFKEDDTRYDYIISQSSSLTEMIERVVNNERLNKGF